MNEKQFRFSKKQWGMYTILYIAGTLLFGFVFYNAWQAAVVLMTGYPIYMLVLRKYVYHRQMLQLKLDFRELMTVLYSLMTAGYSLERAIEASRAELKLCCRRDSYILPELEEICHKMSMNTPVLECLKDFAKKSQDEDIWMFYEVTCIARQHGGSMSAILKNAIERINAGIEMRCEIETTISGKRHEFMIMVIIPLAIILYMRLTSGQLMAVLYTGLVGRCVMSIVLILYGIAVLWGEKMIQINRL